MATPEFWFEFASTCSYPAAARIETLARREEIAVVRCFTPIFADDLDISDPRVTEACLDHAGPGRPMIRPPASP